jgi:hypothetical protein
VVGKWFDGGGLCKQPIRGFFNGIGFTAIYRIGVHRQLDFGAFNEFPFGEGASAELVGFVFDGTNGRNLLMSVCVE